MDCSYIEERNRLAHIVALLLSLAFMAQRAAFGSGRDRRNILVYIRAAEASGLRLAAGYGDWAEGTELPDVGEGNSAEHAIRLAVSLRAVAMALYFHVKSFDAYSAAVHDWVAPDTLKVGSRRMPPAQNQCWSKVPLIDTAPDPPPRSGVRGTAEGGGGG